MPMKPEDVFSEHFRNIMKANQDNINLNVFVVGYKCDQGVRACGGRSGSELGPDNFRELLAKVCHEPESEFFDLTERLRKSKIHIYDLGNISKYTLSKYKLKGRRQSLDIA